MRFAPPKIEHEPPPGAALRASPPSHSLPPLFSPAAVGPLPARPTLLPLTFVLTLVALVACASVALSLTAAFFFLSPRPVFQAANPVVFEAKTAPVAIETPQLAPVKEKIATPAPDTLAVLPFDMLFEPTPTFRRKVEQLNAGLPQLLTEEGKLRVKSLLQTAPLRYRRDPIEAARALKVRAVLVVKFTTEASHDHSTCHLELIDVTSGYLLWGAQIEAPGGFLKNPDCFTQIRDTILDQVPKRLALAP